VGPTKPAENLFFRGIWGWAATLWERLQSTGGRLWSALWAYDGTTWRRQPIIWGYTQSCSESLGEVSDDAGAFYMTFTPVAPGYVRHVDLVSGYDTSNAYAYLQVEMYVAGAWRFLVRHVPCAASRPYGVVQPLTLVEDENIRIRFQGTTIGDNIRAVMVGYEMALTQ